METIVNQEERKSQLIAQGALHRAQIVMAKDSVRTGLQPQALARGAMQQLAVNVSSAFRKPGSTGLSIDRLQTALPLLIAAVSGLMKFKSRKPVLKTVMGSIVAAAVTVVVTAAVSRRKSRGALEVTRQRDAN
jgi:hypothetical protein